MSDRTALAEWLEHIGARSQRYQRPCLAIHLNPAKLGQDNNVLTQMSNYRKRTEVYNGFEIGVNLRFGKAAFYNVA